jgi:hypothetical protein
MAGLVPAIHNHDPELRAEIVIMDGRHKGGHDDGGREPELRGFAALRLRVNRSLPGQTRLMTMMISPPPRLRGSACQSFLSGR